MPQPQPARARARGGGGAREAATPSSLLRRALPGPGRIRRRGFESSRVPFAPGTGPQPAALHIPGRTSPSRDSPASVQHIKLFLKQSLIPLTAYLIDPGSCDRRLLFSAHGFLGLYQLESQDNLYRSLPVSSELYDFLKQKQQYRDFLAVVKTLRFHRRGRGFHPWWRTKFPQATQRGQKGKTANNKTGVYSLLIGIKTTVW